MKIVFLILSIAMTSCKGLHDKKVVNVHSEKEISFSSDTLPRISDNIMSVYQDSKNNYWFGSWKDGVYKFDGKNVTHFTAKKGLPSDRVEEIKEDKFGNIFINTSKGLCKYDGLMMQEIVASSPQEVRWILKPDDLWFKSTVRGHIARYDGKALHHLKIPTCNIGEAYMTKNPTAISPYDIYWIYKDSRGNIWFGTGGVGTFRYNGVSFDWINEDDVTELHDGPANGVRSIIEDSDGYFWFNSEYRYKVYDKSGLDIPKTNGKFYERIQSIGNLNGPNSFLLNANINEYLAIAKDNNDHLWIATYMHGVWKVDGKKVTHYAVRENGKDILLFYVYKDNHGTIWLGTHENGVWKLEGDGFERFM